MVPAILNESGEELEGPNEGYLVRGFCFHLKDFNVLCAVKISQKKEIKVW